MTIWSPQQEDALRAVDRWLARGDEQVFRLYGWAGTGKTTLAREIGSNVHGRAVYGAFTGKAALVLRTKGCVGASTLHSMIYSVDEDAFTGVTRFVLNLDSDVKDAAVIIVDEVSMVDEKLGRDLLSFKRPVLVLGDPFQLPPVRGGGFFTEHKPHIMLTEIHRQARDNPIVAMAETIRTGGKLQLGTYGESRVITRADVTADDVLAAGQVIVGRNRSRHNFNGRIRELLGRRHRDIPEVGDKLVCLRNAHMKGLLNGGLWTAQEVTNGDVKRRRPSKATATGRSRKPLPPIEDAKVFNLVVAPEDQGMRDKNVEVSVPREFFNGTEDDLPWESRKGREEFTFGYALTCHKAQGSQWDDVLVFDESAAFREHAARWQYTALTRAAERVTFVQNRGE